MAAAATSTCASMRTRRTCSCPRCVHLRHTGPACRRLVVATRVAHLSALDCLSLITLFFSPSLSLSLPLEVSTLSSLVLRCRRCVVFTGAGVSTASRIPDYRSGANTGLECGPGRYHTKTTTTPAAAAAAASTTTPAAGPAAGVLPSPVPVSTLRALPSTAHMSLVALHHRGLVRHLISQNTDGLHLRSGFPAANLSELHGNANIEACARCGHEYMRDVITRTGEESATGRRCIQPGCTGDLHHTIVDFDQKPRAQALASASHACQQADLCLVLGSSLSVRPAADLPQWVREKEPRGQLVIVNLQRTKADSKAQVRIFARIDRVFELLMAQLQIAIPPFRLQRLVQLTQFVDAECRPQVHVEGRTSDDRSAVDCFRRVHLCDRRSQAEPHQLVLHSCLTRRGALAHHLPTTETLTLETYGHYGEPPIEVRFPVTSHSVQVWSLTFDPASRQWETPRLIDQRVGREADRIIHRVAGGQGGAINADLTDAVPTAAAMRESSQLPKAGPIQAKIVLKPNGAQKRFDAEQVIMSRKDAMTD